MRVAMLTREFPPAVYGGAGVHVDQLSRALRGRAAELEVDLEVHCLGEPRPGAIAHSEEDPRLDRANPALRILAADLEMVSALDRPGAPTVELVHSHTWYTGLAGHLAHVLYDVPHVVTAHSLEPLRPWKAEQLGGGYRLSSWAERTAYESADAVIAVSRAMRTDVLSCYPVLDPDRVHVVYNGIDTTRYRPEPATDVIERLGIDPTRPYIVFVGRITRQKGLPHLLEAVAHLDPDVQVLLLAGAADTPELGEQVASAVARLQATRSGVIWVQQMLPVPEVIQALTHASVFCCPSIYEPQGIVNLEAMACETAVVASAVGGIPEVVVDGETGRLVPYDEGDPRAFEHDLAEAISALVADPGQAKAFGAAGRRRAVEDFDWNAIADRTVEIYRTISG
ncbi:MAG TPA: glycogen synthase [Actinopolymorphaceae bacterium]